MISKKQRRLLWIGVACIFYIARSLYISYERKVTKWHEQAKITLEEALQCEILRYDTTALSYYINKSGDIQKAQRCNLLSSSLANIPLSADSLNRVWRELLYQADIPIKTCVGISGANDSASVSYSEALFKPLPEDSLRSFYMGSHREVEITGFIFYRWWDIFDGRLPIQMALLIAGFGLSLFLTKKQLEWVFYLTNKRKSSTVKDDTVVPVVNVIQSPTYQLEDEVFFYAELRTLKRKDDIVKLTPQLSILLEAFLKADQHKLTQKEMDRMLWPDGSGTPERLYTAVCRLRKALEKISSYQVDCRIDVYQLKKYQENAG